MCCVLCVCVVCVCACVRVRVRVHVCVRACVRTCVRGRGGAIEGFQMSNISSGGQMHNQEAAVQQTFHFQFIWY